jgi:rhodanese-related sulfurtransferase
MKQQGKRQAAWQRTITGLVGGIVLGFGVASGALAADTPANLDGVTVVTAEQAKQMQEKGVPLIDARVASEYAEKTVKGAISVPYNEKSAKDVRFDRKQDRFDISKLPADKNAPLVFFCNAGECWKSYKASVVARDGGYKRVYWMRGGVPEWIAKGLPTQ